MAASTAKLPNGAQIPFIGIGTWNAINEEEIENALNTALKNGYRHIDTAYVYQNEKVIGRVLKKWFASGQLKRDDVFISTKLPMTGIRPEKVEHFLKESLSNLQLDYVDLYLIHFPICIDLSFPDLQKAMAANSVLKTLPKTDHVGVWRKMEEQVRAGRANAIGVSNYSKKQVQTVLEAAEIKPASLQIEDHLYLQQNELVEYCQKNGIVVVAYSPLGSPGYNKFLERYGQETKVLPNILQDATVSSIGKKHNKSPAQVALRFLIQRNIVAIPKSVTEKRVIENISVFDFQLDEGDMNALRKLDVGEDARVCDFEQMKGLKTHHDFPFPKN